MRGGEAERTRAIKICNASVSGRGDVCVATVVQQKGKFPSGWFSKVPSLASGGCTLN